MFVVGVATGADLVTGLFEMGQNNSEFLGNLIGQGRSGCVGESLQTGCFFRSSKYRPAAFCCLHGKVFCENRLLTDWYLSTVPEPCSIFSRSTGFLLLQTGGNFGGSSLPGLGPSLVCSWKRSKYDAPFPGSHTIFRSSIRGLGLKHSEAVHVPSTTTYNG